MAWHQVIMVCWFLRCWQQSCFVACQAERSEACQKILRQRMSEGLLHKARLVADVTKLEGANDHEAEGCIGGFPCQVQASIQCLKCTAFSMVFFQKGHVACPGYINGRVDVWNRRGTKFHGERNLSHIRRAPQPAQVLVSALTCLRVVLYHQFFMSRTPPARRVILLENVLGLLSRKKETRELLAYIIQACCYDRQQRG